MYLKYLRASVEVWVWDFQPEKRDDFEDNQFASRGNNFIH